MLLAAPCCLLYLAAIWAIFVALADHDGERHRVDQERIAAFLYYIPDVQENFPIALRSLATAPFLTHDSTQLVYVSGLILLFGVAFEVREGTRATLAIFFGASFVGALAGALPVILAYPELSTDPFLASVWERGWCGGSAGCFGLMGAVAARARRPWALLALVAAWEIGIQSWRLHSYTVTFHFIALAAGYLAVRYALRSTPVSVQELSAGFGAVPRLGAVSVSPWTEVRAE